MLVWVCIVFFLGLIALRVLLPIPQWPAALAMPPRPHPANAPGDFYVEEGCCTMCGVPLDEAPEVFAWVREKDQCVVAHQPTTPQSIDRTLNAMWAGEMNCIRYRGNDSTIARRIVEMGNAGLCDQSIATGATPLVRSHVRFRAVEVGAPMDVTEIATSFLRHFMGQSNSQTNRSARLALSGNRHATAYVSWFDGVQHSVTFERIDIGVWHAVTKPSVALAAIGLSRIVERWLHDNEHVSEIRWFFDEQWQSGGGEHPTVI